MAWVKGVAEDGVTTSGQSNKVAAVTGSAGDSSGNGSGNGDSDGEADHDMAPDAIDDGAAAATMDSDMTTQAQTMDVDDVTTQAQTQEAAGTESDAQAVAAD